MAITIIPHHENTVAYGINIHAQLDVSSSSSKLQTCFLCSMQLFYVKGRCNNIDHVSIEPIVQSRQLQWPIL